MNLYAALVLVIALVPSAHALSPDLAEGNLLAQTRPIVMGEGTLKLFCDGREVSQATGATCCELEVFSGWRLNRTLQPGYRRIRATMFDSNRGVVHLDVQNVERQGMPREYDHQIALRCRTARPTRAVLKRAFGDVFTFVAERAAPARAAVTLDPRRRPNLPFDFTADDPTPVLAPAVTIVTHASTEFDTRSFSGAGVNALLDYSRSHAIPTIGVIHLPDLADAQMYPAAHVNYLVQSDPGGLDLRFPATTDFIFGGGNLNACLCETIRDATRSSLGEHQTKNVYLVTEAIFDQARMLLLDSKRQGNDTVFSSRYPVRLTDPTDFFSGAYPLADLTAAMAKYPREFGRWVSHALIGEPNENAMPRRPFCLQNGTNNPNVDPDAVIYEIYLDGKLVQTVRHSSAATRTIRLIFTKLADLDANRARFQSSAP